MARATPGSGYVGRFAPSPTGALHLGSMLAAIASYLDARARGGRWLLRLDDLDTPRNEPGADQAIVLELHRIGLDWDGPVHRQSETPDRYRRALESLRRAQASYPCGCSRRALVDGIYPGHCRQGLAAGMQARSHRLRVGSQIVSFNDAIQGPWSQCLGTEVGDFVVHRADGIPAYHLATVVDDALAGVSHVVRGADLLASTPRQIALQRALGLATPHYAHLPLLSSPQGQKLSKQNHAPATRERTAQSIWQACLHALNQPVERDLASMGIAEIKQLAIDNWRLERVPRAL